jgi:TonB family protein
MRSSFLFLLFLSPIISTGQECVPKKDDNCAAAESLVHTQQRTKPSQNFQDSDKDYRPERNARPIYPTLSKRLNEQGTVDLRILVTSTGEVGALEVRNSSGFERLDQAAVEAVKTWRFNPATVDGKPVDAWYLIPVTFKLAELDLEQKINPNNLSFCPKPDVSMGSDHERLTKWDNCWGKYQLELNKDHKGDILEGEWRNGKLHGLGMRYYLAENQFKGAKYVGEYRNYRMHGRGTYTFAGGTKYIGQFKDDMPNGRGAYYYQSDSKAKGSTYIGEVVEGRLHGKGTFTFADGSRYVGEFKGSKKHGQGISTQSDGSRIEGVWENDKLISQAKLNSTNIDDSNVGTTDSSKLPTCKGNDKTKWSQCRGSESIPNGHNYTGDYLNGERDGHGVMEVTFSEKKGDRYIGQFKKGKFHGYGTYIYVNGDKYVGEYTAGLRNGQGTFTSTQGHSYTGEWRNNQTHGIGKETFSDGSPPKVGIFENGKFVKSE